MLTPEVTRLRRKALGLSQPELAKRAGVSLSTIERLERGIGKRIPAHERLILDALGLKPSLNGAEEEVGP